jgi:signal transduction histidine kinase
VDTALHDLGERVREAGAEVEVGPLPTVLADAGQVQQLFQNLLSNALKFHAPDQAPEVRVSAERMDGDGMWRIAVADNGVGIAAADQQRVFEVFRRLHTREEYEGTGIGLAVVQRIVERHGGRVWLESAPGEGTTFYFTLPEAAEGDASAGAP